MLEGLCARYVSPWLPEHWPFDVDKDLQPITQLVSFPNLLFVNPKLDVKSLPELIAYLKKNEGKTNYGTSGHLSVVMFDSALSDSPDAFAAFTRAERVKWAEVVKAAGVKIE